MLYRIYRPKTFAEVEGQEAIVQTMQGALASGRVGHAYLFCGPRGTGKTTMARLLAKALNCTRKKTIDNGLSTMAGKGSKNTEPCNVCPSCVAINENRSLDLIEIDAASNRGIDEIRAIKDSVSVAASSSEYKVFIIDEVHMLTTPAFNALLKTLEEPPSHAVFILATTEVHKIPATILSRVQRFDFKKINTKDIAKKIKDIAKKEKITIDAAAIDIITQAAGGSMRDAESIFAKLIAYSGQVITGALAAEILGITPREKYERLLEHLAKKETEAAIALINGLYAEGFDLEQFTKHFLIFLREQLVAKVSSTSRADAKVPEPGQMVAMINEFLRAGQEFKSSPIPQLPLELVIVRLTSH